MTGWGSTQTVSEERMAEMAVLVREEKLWLQVESWRYCKQGDNEGGGDREMLRTCPHGGNVKVGGKVAFFRPVEGGDIEYIAKHNKTGDNCGFAYIINSFFIRDGNNFTLLYKN